MTFSAAARRGAAQNSPTATYTACNSFTNAHPKAVGFIGVGGVDGTALPQIMIKTHIVRQTNNTTRTAWFMQHGIPQQPAKPPIKPISEAN